MNYKKASQISTVLYVAAIVIALCLFVFSLTAALFAVIIAAALALMIGSFIIKYKFYRCPHCHAMLPSKRLLGSVCKECGKKLDE